MTIRSLRWNVLVLSAALAVLSGCSDDPNKGYTTQSLFRPGIKSIAVPIWTRGKDVYRRDLEMQLTEAIQKRIMLATPYKLTEKSRADTVLTGSIDEISQRVLSYNPDTGLAREMEITMYVSFTWKDLRPDRGGKIIVEQARFRVAGTYLPPAPFSEDFFQGNQDVIDRMATQVVEQLEIPMTR